MKIFFIISTLSSGGAERNASIIANYFSHNHEVIILTFQNKSENFYKINKNIKILNLHLLQNSQNFLLKFINFIKRLYVINSELRKGKPDVVISFLETTNITTLISSFWVSSVKKRVISDRNDPRRSERPILLSFLKFIFYRFADYLVLQTNKIKHNYTFLEKKKIVVIPNTISEKIFYKDNYKLQKFIKIISVGRLEYQKGYDVLLNTLNLLNSKKIKFICDIYGAGSEKKKINEKIKDLKLYKKVNIKGVRKDILKIYKKYDFFILSSRFEGYPNSLLEAMSSGLVSISSNCDYGPKEIISNYKNGLLFKNEDFKDLLKKIDYLLKNKNKFKLMGKNAKKNFNPKKFNSAKLNKWKKIIKLN